MLFEQIAAMVSNTFVVFVEINEGWVDDSNPNESVVLFDGMDDLLDFYERAYVKDERNPWRESCTSYAEVDR